MQTQNEKETRVTCVCVRKTFLDFGILDYWNNSGILLPYLQLPQGR